MRGDGSVPSRPSRRHLRRASAGDRLDRKDFMRDVVAADLQPGAATAAMIPKLLHLAGDIVAQVDVVVDGILAGVRPGALRLGVAQIGELAVLARAAEGT